MRTSSGRSEVVVAFVPWLVTSVDDVHHLNGTFLATAMDRSRQAEVLARHGLASGADTMGASVYKAGWSHFASSVF